MNNNIINKGFRTTQDELPSSFSNRELAIIVKMPRKAVWNFCSRLEKDGIVRRSTSIPVDFWKILDEENFKKELKRFVT